MMVADLLVTWVLGIWKARAPTSWIIGSDTEPIFLMTSLLVTRKRKVRATLKNKYGCSPEEVADSYLDDDMGVSGGIDPGYTESEDYGSLGQGGDGYNEDY